MQQPEFNPATTDAWVRLERLAQRNRADRINNYFTADENRLDSFSVQSGDLYLDYSKNLVTREVMNGLNELASASPLMEQCQAMFNGKMINYSENRAVLHTALRNPDCDLVIDGISIAGEIKKQLLHMKQISEAINSGRWVGATDRPINTIVNIGIGGSDFGPKMVTEALGEFASPKIRTHFLSNVDGAEVAGLLKNLDPATTLFIICSKTFTTQETMMNAGIARDWLLTELGVPLNSLAPHLIAVTAKPDAARRFGLVSENILELWDWVGGRYSLWSAVGLSVSISIGFEQFVELLKGARSMDEHFLSQPYQQNMPVILALLGIWYNNFLQAQSTAIIPYCQRLASLPSFLQQLDMESNGKSAMSSDKPVEVSTGPIVWGQTGTNGQHAFFQLLHQGAKLVPVDFIGIVDEQLGDPDQHRVLMANMIAQSAALMTGESNTDLNRHYPGNKPSNTLLLSALTPHSLGGLIALYEHKVFVQGVIWGINSFDQWGVELGKKVATSLLEHPISSSLDPSTEALLKRTKLSAD